MEAWPSQQAVRRGVPPRASCESDPRRRPEAGSPLLHRRPSRRHEARDQSRCRPMMIFEIRLLRTFGPEGLLEVSD